MLPIPIVALWWSYLGFMRLEETISRTLSGSAPISLEQQKASIGLSIRTVIVLFIVLGAQWYKYGGPDPDSMLPIVIFGISKALSWFFTAQTVCIVPLSQQWIKLN